ncbi:hypothetical protein G7046_g9137 [Stylonectria norvegica]|nr:hypothetical protein G7046_g9137 [Stylonectria norvegica]
MHNDASKRARHGWPAYFPCSPRRRAHIHRVGLLPAHINAFLANVNIVSRLLLVVQSSVLLHFARLLLLLQPSLERLVQPALYPGRLCLAIYETSFPSTTREYSNILNMPRPVRRGQAKTTGRQAIDIFTRVSKGQSFHDSAIKKIAVEPTATRKRKATSIEEEDHPRLTSRTISFQPSSDDESTPVKRACRRQEPQITPRKPGRPAIKGKRIARTTPSKTEAAHKPRESTAISQSNTQSKVVQTKIDTALKKLSKAADESKSDGLPKHLADLVHLHKAFIKTVMVHFAHHGTNSPIDLRTTIPQISRTWGKRQVTIEDIRRCIGLETFTKLEIISPFIVTDYGRGKVCIELASGADAKPINEEKLCRQFQENLQILCAEKAMDEMANVDITLESLSLADLPKATITDMNAGNNVNPILKKGQRALSELKNGITAKQQEKEAKLIAISNNPTLNPDGTKMSLLDRLRLKQLTKANGPAAPSGPELQRRAALNRVADVAATISMLSLSNPMSLPRQAFAMPAILEKLKDSLRTPMSREEGTTCVRLIAAEVAPEWLRIVTIGGRENVVVQRNYQPVDRVLQERVQKMMA